MSACLAQLSVPGEIVDVPQRGRTVVAAAEQGAAVGTAGEGVDKVPAPLTTARTHKILRICARQGVLLLADMAYIDTGDWVTTTKRRPPHGELTLTERTENRALSAPRAPAKREMTRLKSCRSRISLNRMNVIIKAVLTLERQR